MNIPQYRAKKIDSDEYIIGELVTDNVGQKIILEDCVVYNEFKSDGDWKQGITNSFNSIIDPSTLSINLSDMIDSEGTKIFASLSEHGKGGDILLREDTVETETLIYKDFTIRTYIYWFETWKELFRFKVIGIQQ